MQNQSIETLDLILCKAKIEDAESLFKNYWSQPESAKYMLWTPCKSLDLAKIRMEKLIEFQKNHLSFIVKEKESGEVIGMAGFEEIEPNVYEDIGFGIGPKYFKKGYGKQILNGFIDYLKSIGAKKIICSCDKRNLASAGLQKSCGLKYVYSKNGVKNKDSEQYTADYYSIEF